MSRWPILRYLLGSHTIFLLFIMFGVYLFIGVVVAVVAQFTEIRLSGVDAIGQALPWVALGYGATAVNLVATTLVHGRTRREFLAQHPVFQVITTMLIAALITGAFAIETLVYRSLDWQQKVQEQRSYASASDYPMIFATHWGMLMTWLMIGVFIGVAFYRWEAVGGLALLPAAVLVLFTGGINGFFSLPFARTDLPLLPVTLTAVAAAYALLWVSARDMPLKTRVA
ncbi:heme exporter protein D [Actinoplanes lutulentus]|uniref:Uncharacterized protein n=1 Tax=Actinoplanes lutulentus TaxID=1287878 RepID=A0A327Z4M7_9ACTN|nr:hypothetical protein [Actinoplanes lutulentus]MBB2948230.1 heme exporter protein D [Actinoplanes lutulentus]RAK31271.1 hypothetical protein B0I29_11577 [Actinoplanes lutulentus]